MAELIDRCAAITAPSGPASRDPTKINLLRNDDESNTIPVSLSVGKNLK